MNWSATLLAYVSTDTVKLIAAVVSMTGVVVLFEAGVDWAVQRRRN